MVLECTYDGYFYVSFSIILLECKIIFTFIYFVSDDRAERSIVLNFFVFLDSFEFCITCERNTIHIHPYIYG